MTLPETEAREYPEHGQGWCVVVTDGQENSSKEFNLEQIKKMIERQENEYNWEFTFLAAGKEAFADGMKMGFMPSKSAVFDSVKTNVAYAAVSNSVLRSRTASQAGQDASIGYTDDERKSIA